MTIPTGEQLREEGKAALARQELALMIEQVMLRNSEKGEEWALIRAKQILAAKSHVLNGQPAPRSCIATETPEPTIANGAERSVAATKATKG